jgi:EpsI family protein
MVAPSRRPLRMSLEEAIPARLGEFEGRSVAIPEEEKQVAGVTSYLFRSYRNSSPHDRGGFTVYVGYYDSQMQGKTIHSPKNCLPGAGWEALQSSTMAVQTAAGPVTVNRYLIRKDTHQALVLYWYQGRGRIQANEYLVKWNLLRDAALRHRSEEALVRILVPLGEDQASAVQMAGNAAASVLSTLNQALPL